MGLNPLLFFHEGQRKRVLSCLFRRLLVIIMILCWWQKAFRSSGATFTLGHTLDEPVTVPQAAGCITQPCCGVNLGMRPGWGDS